MNKAKLSILATILIAASLAGCATSTGNASITNDRKISSIQEGKTTMKEVESILGRPNSVDLAESGEQVWFYQRIENSAMASIPFLNMMGNNGKESTLTIRFTKKGVVKALARGENKL